VTLKLLRKSLVNGEQHLEPANLRICESVNLRTCEQSLPLINAVPASP